MGMTPEKYYAEALEKIKVIEVVLQPAEIADMYLDAAKDMEAAGEYRDAKQLAQEYRELAKKAVEDGKEQLYQRACARMDAAQDIIGRKLAIDTFERVSGYKDADELAQKCRKLNEEASKKKMISGWVMMFAAGAAVVAAAMLIFSPLPKYQEAQRLFKKGNYKEAKIMYQKLENYRDCEEKVLLCKEKEKEAERLQAMDRLAKAEKGDSVVFGPYTWVVLETDEEEYTLLGAHSDWYEEWTDVPYHEAAEAVTWEESSLRAWLNGEFLDTFTEEEKEQILMTTVKNPSNPRYGTEGGKDTKDQVYLLSIEEAETYMDTIQTMSLNWLLRTPGMTKQMVSYVTSDHQIVEYGCPVEWDEYEIRPVIRIKRTV